MSLREIAEKTVSPEDLKEDLIHSLQKYVEVDEPEADDVPLIAGGGGSVDSDDTEVAAEHMSEEELLKGLEGPGPARGAARARRRRIRLWHRSLPGCFRLEAFGRSRPGFWPGHSHFMNRFSRPCEAVESP